LAQSWYGRRADIFILGSNQGMTLKKEFTTSITAKVVKVEKRLIYISILYNKIVIFK